MLINSSTTKAMQHTSKQSKSKRKHNKIKSKKLVQNQCGQGLQKEKNCDYFYLSNKKPNKDLSQPIKIFLQPIRDLS
jgi:hypothetical protein